MKRGLSVLVDHNPTSFYTIQATYHLNKAIAAADTSVVSDSVRPRPWDSARKDTGVGCHFLLQTKVIRDD